VRWRPHLLPQRLRRLHRRRLPPARPGQRVWKHVLPGRPTAASPQLRDIPLRKRGEVTLLPGGPGRGGRLRGVLSSGADRIGRALLCAREGRLRRRLVLPRHLPGRDVSVGHHGRGVRPEGVHGGVRAALPLARVR
jgi:hypothetical protein